MNKVVVKKIEDKEIVWFKNSNSYLVLEPVAAAIILKINKNNSLEEIKTWAFKKNTTPKKVVKKFIEDIFLLYTVNNTLKKEVQNNSETYKIPTKYYSEKYYSIHNYIFKVQFETKFHLLKIHPTFAHLETGKVKINFISIIQFLMTKISCVF